MQANLSPGYVFAPTDLQIIVHYLKGRVLKQEAYPGVIRTVELYACEPWQLPGAHICHDGIQSVYYFALTKPRSRKVGKGTWKTSQGDKSVCKDGRVIGLVKSFNFRLAEDAGIPNSTKDRLKTNWIMHEYRLPSNRENTKDNYWAVCKISMTGRSSEHGQEAAAEVMNCPSMVQPQNSCSQFEGQISDILGQHNNEMVNPMFQCNNGATPRFLPPGYLFEPTDVQIIVYYLKEKVRNEYYYTSDILEVNLYAYEPWNLPGAALCYDRVTSIYFFVQTTPRSRVAGKGTWKTSQGDKDIYDKRMLVGLMKSFTYRSKGNNAVKRNSTKDGLKTRWTMHEYRLSSQGENTKEKYWAVCKVSMSGRSSEHDYEVEMEAATNASHGPSTMQCQDIDECKKLTSQQRFGEYHDELVYPAFQPDHGATLMNGTPYTQASWTKGW